MRNDVLKRVLAFAGAVLGAAGLLFAFLDLLPGASAETALDARLLALLGSAEQWERLTVTLPLVFLALAIAGLGGTVLRHLPLAGGGLATVLAVVPPFWLGMVLSLLVAGVLNLLPASGFVPWSDPAGALASLVLPALALGLPYAGQVALKLQGRRLSALVALLGRAFPGLLAAAVLVETVFYLPGLGRLVLGAAQQQDLTTLRAGLFVLVLVGATGLLLAGLARPLFEREQRQ